MTDLLFAGGNNPAGTHLIRCVPVIGVSSLPATSASLTVAGNPTFRAGFSWMFLYGTDGTKTYEEESEETDNGTVWTLSAGLFHPNDSPAIRSTLAGMMAYRYLLDIQDNTGQWRRLGGLIESMRFKYKFGIGPNMGDRRGYTLSFSGTMTSSPPLVTGL